MRGFCPVILALISILIACDAAFAASRVALIIGNSNYEHVARLNNPVNDARAMTDKLRAGGFDLVESRTDLRIADMRRVLREFADKARSADIALIYYAGHGIEVEGTNYLIPVDAALERDTDVYDEALSLDRILIAVEPAKQLRLVIMDACRDNPFSKRMKHAGTRSIGRGLARIEPMSHNTLIAYAAKAGSTALDGDSANSPFATALMRHLTTPGLDIRKAFGFVRDDVLKVTNNRQEPYVYGSLGGEDLSLVPAQTSPTTSVPGNTDSRADIRRDYELALQLATRDGWSAFLTQYPTGFYANLAKGQLNKIDAEDARRIATEKARLAEEQRQRLVQDGARKAEQTKAAALAKATEEQRLSAEREKQKVEAKIAVAEKERQSKERQTVTQQSPADDAPTPSQQIASLPPSEPSESSLGSAKETARQIQAELHRMGCYSGPQDGDWASSTKSALQQFNQRTKSGFDLARPNQSTVDGLKNQKSSICSSDLKPLDRKARRKMTPPKRAAGGASHGRCFIVGNQRYCE